MKFHSFLSSDLGLPFSQCGWENKHMDKLMLFNKIETCEVEKISSTTNSFDEMIVPSY